MEKKNVKVVDAVNNKKKPKKKERICEIGYMKRMNCEVKMVKEILGTMMMERGYWRDRIPTQNHGLS